MPRLQMPRFQTGTRVTVAFLQQIAWHRRTAARRKRSFSFPFTT